MRPPEPIVLLEHVAMILAALQKRLKIVREPHTLILERELWTLRKRYADYG